MNTGGYLRLFFLVIVTFFLVISFAPLVDAETAWIKWEHETHQKKEGAKVTFDKWYLQEAFPSYGACMSAIHSTAKNGCEGDKVFDNCYAGDDYLRFSFNSQDEFATLSFHCYPDTIDPRK